MILHTPEGSVLVKGIKMKKILKFALSRLLKSLTYDNNQGNQSNFTVNIQFIYKNEAQKYAQNMLPFWGESEPHYAYKRYAYKKICMSNPMKPYLRCQGFQSFPVIKA